MTATHPTRVNLNSINVKDSQGADVPFNNTATNSPVAYLPQLIGFGLGKILSLNTRTAFILAETVTLLSFAIFMGLAVAALPEWHIIVGCLLPLISFPFVRDFSGPIHPDDGDAFHMHALPIHHSKSFHNLFGPAISYWHPTVNGQIRLCAVDDSAIVRPMVAKPYGTIDKVRADSKARSKITSSRAHCTTFAEQAQARFHFHPDSRHPGLVPLAFLLDARDQLVHHDSDARFL